MKNLLKSIVTDPQIICLVLTVICFVAFVVFVCIGIASNIRYYIFILPALLMLLFIFDQLDDIKRGY